MKPCDTCDGAIEGKCLSVLAEQPSVREFSADGIFVAQICIAKSGTLTPQHSHSYDHMTFLAKGIVNVYRADALMEHIQAPSFIMIPAYTKHLFETLVDDVILLCIHNISRSGKIVVAEEHQLVTECP